MRPRYYRKALNGRVGGSGRMDSPPWIGRRPVWAGAAAVLAGFSRFLSNLNASWLALTPAFCVAPAVAQPGYAPASAL